MSDDRELLAEFNKDVKVQLRANGFSRKEIKSLLTKEGDLRVEKLGKAFREKEAQQSLV